MFDGSGQRAMDAFDAGAHPDNMRSIPYTKHNNTFIRTITVNLLDQRYIMILGNTILQTG